MTDPASPEAVTDALDPPTLLALAARVESEGRYNVAKLLRAAVAARVQRAADERLATAPRGEALLAALAGVADAVAADPLLAPLAPSLRAGLRRYAGGEVPLLADVPDPCVCRRCGHVVAGDPDDVASAGAACPRCGADAVTFWVQRPVWWFDRYDPPGALAALARTPAKLQALFARVPRDAWTARPAPDTWSPREVLMHLRDAQAVLEARVERILTEDDPAIDSAAVWSWNAQRRDAGTEAVLEVYLASRERVLTRLRAVPADAWWRTGRHQEFGRLTLTQQVSYFAAHEPTHLRQLRAALPSEAALG